jgi:hypothetical protein
MPTKTGYNNLVKNSIFNINRNNIANKNNIIGEEILTARVKKIILDNISEPELFNKYGEWSSIGGILFEDAKNPLLPDDFSYEELFAYPLFPNIKHYPLINELVHIITLPSPRIQSNTNDKINYYLPPVNTWGSIHHNAVPNTVFTSLVPESQQKTYNDVRSGNLAKVTDGVTEAKLGNTFVEKANIKSLLPYEGDVIYEGRWGNSIRLSSTIKQKNTPFGLNNWSKGASKSGEPIIILRNGQYTDEKDPWVPIVEDINKDQSSIYLTSTQEIPLPSSYNLSQADFSVSTYSSSPQIILNSGRLVFNSNTDSIGLTSNKQILLGAQEKIYLESKETSLVSRKIYLGSEDATEPLLLGNKTIEIFQQILTSLQSLANVLPTVGTSESTVPGTPNIKVTTAAANLSATLGELIPRLESLKSKQNYTL